MKYIKKFGEGLADIFRACTFYDCPYFDREFYYETYPDVKRSWLPAELHFARHGVEEGRLASLLFDPVFYLDVNHDAKRDNIHPLTHFMRKGRHAWRLSFPLLSRFCNICGGSDFGPGPGGRIRPRKIFPYCKTCQSLERHRVFRGIWNKLPEVFLKDKQALQFSNDQAVPFNLFAHFEVSVFGVKNSLDLQKIDKEDGSYDVVIVNHVLEHVENDKKALKEIARVCKPSGFLEISFPDPLRFKDTEDWGYTKDKLHGHYRMYGIDVIKKIKKTLPGHRILQVISQDPVTGLSDCMFFLSQDKKTFSFLSNAFRCIEHSIF